MMTLAEIEDVLEQFNEVADTMTYEQIVDIADNYNRLIPEDLGHVQLFKQFNDMYELHVFVHKNNAIDIATDRVFDRIHNVVCDHHMFTEGQCDICGSCLVSADNDVYGLIPESIVNEYERQLDKFNPK